MTAPDASLRGTLAPLIGQVSRLWRRTVDRRLQPFGLSQASWRPLLHLARAPAPIHQKDLANALLVDSSSMVRVLDALQQNGFIERREGRPDRRAKQILLTESGRTTVTQLEQVATQVSDEALSDIPEADLVTTLRVMERIRTALERSAEASPE